MVLSGTGSDGSRGLEAVSEAEGLSLVQSPSTAEFDGMPQSAISTGFVDQVLSPSDLATFINDVLIKGSSHSNGSWTKEHLSDLDQTRVKKNCGIAQRIRGA